jgi:hypothetical protein
MIIDGKKFSLVQAAEVARERRKRGGARKHKKEKACSGSVLGENTKK